MNQKIRITDIIKMKNDGIKIVAITAYDYLSAVIADNIGIDIILVGDTCGMVMLGYDSTIPITMDEMIHHCKAVKRGVKKSLIVGDMPFMSYNVSKTEAIKNACRFIKEGGCDAVKLEGGTEIIKITKAIIDAGIPVMGHIGLTPQTASLYSGYVVKGKSVEEALKLMKDVKSLEKAGVFSIIFESITTEVTEIIGKGLKVPIIGIGSGPNCDGQILVLHDLIGLFDQFVPKFVKRYANIKEEINNALKAYKDEVKTGKFPTQQNCYHMDEFEYHRLKREIRNN